MAIDNRDKRASAAGVALVFLLQPPLPDGSISGVDKQHASNAYRGIAAAVPSVDLNDVQATQLGTTGTPQVYFPDDVAVTPAANDLRDCNVYKTLICTRIVYEVSITTTNDYDIQIDLPSDLKTMICTRNAHSVPITTTNDLNTPIGCS